MVEFLHVIYGNVYRCFGKLSLLILLVKSFLGGANSPILFLLGASIYAFAIMLVIVSVDKALNPLWNKLISIAERYDKKWNVKDVR